jgi:hypothetical protein
MTAEPLWPSGARELVPWAQTVAVWLISAYALSPDASRPRPSGSHRARARLLFAVLAAALGAWFVPPPGSSAGSRAGLSLLLAAAVLATHVGRARLTHGARGKQLLTEWELASNALVLTASAWLVAGAELAAPRAGAGKLAAVALVLSSLVFVFRGGTYVVRGLLDKTNAVPRLRGSEAAPSKQRELDVPELNRGRTIGNLERLLMVMVIALGSYEALGFLIAAKGLIRAREFEDRDFAEYFILGSLASTAVALVVGIAVRVSVPFLWRLAP